VVPGSVLPSKPAPASSPAISPVAQKLLEASEAGDLAEVKNLLRGGASVNARGSYGHTALMGAAVRGHTDTVRLLVKRGADVNARGGTGRTALIEAAAEGYTNTVRVLLESGADVNAKDNDGWSALFWAAFSGRTETVRALLEKGADVNAKNNFEDSALIQAAYGGDTSTVSLLLEKGAVIDVKDDQGRTALIEASRQGHADTVRVLLEKGADLSAQDKGGDTALSMAQKNNYPDVFALLRIAAGRSSDKSARSTGTNPADAPKVSASPRANPVKASVEALDKKSLAQAFYRLGLDMQMIDVSWSQNSPLASRSAHSIQEDLKKVTAPTDLIELAHQANVRLDAPTEDNTGSLARVVRDLRARLDKYCRAQADGEFFYAAGGYTMDLTLLGEKLKNPQEAAPSVEDGRRKTVPVAAVIAAECSATENCKEHALPYFVSAATILRKPRLGPADGPALVSVSSDLERTLSGDER
jgi:ankyrin repeat protein